MVINLFFIDYATTKHFINICPDYVYKNFITRYPGIRANLPSDTNIISVVQGKDYTFRSNATSSSR